MPGDYILYEKLLLLVMSRMHLNVNRFRHPINVQLLFPLMVQTTMSGGRHFLLRNRKFYLRMWCSPYGLTYLKKVYRVDRRATFKLPGLSGAPGQKSGISASSSSRVIKFLPPPRDTSKNSSLEPISQHQPLSPTIDSSDVPKVM